MSAGEFLSDLHQKLPLGMTIRQAAVLCVLAEAPAPVVFKDLAAKVNVQAGVLCRILDTLDAMELTERVKGANWRKRVSVRVTTAGTALAEQIGADMAAAVQP